MSSKGNMYDFITKTKNPLCGECPHKCIYCYIEKQKRFPVIRKKYSGEIRLDEKVLSEKLGSGKFYFIQSMGDLFAWNVPFHMIIIILEWLKKYPDNTYLLQTKNPARVLGFYSFFPKNTIVGTTIESNIDHPGISMAPNINERIMAMVKLQEIGFTTMVTIEPVLDFDIDKLVELIEIINPEWVNLGADSGGHKLPEPSKEKLLELIDRVEIRKKPNLNRLLR